MEQAIYFLFPIFLFVSLIYAMSGQGGASAYLAILAISDISYNKIPATALACNIAATIGIVYRFYKEGHLKLRLCLPFVITSIPAAFFAGRIDVPEKIFIILLSCILILIGLRLLLVKTNESRVKMPEIKTALIFGPLIGIVLGSLGGLVGLGGGIFLMPIIILLRWGTVKQAAVAGGLFTLINSISAITGHISKSGFDWKLAPPLAIAVIIGSQIGSYIGAKKASPNLVQKIFAVIMLGIGIRLIIKSFGV